MAVYKGDATIVNCVQPHPYLCFLATSGIDREILLWSPKAEEFDPDNRVSYYDTMVVVNQQVFTEFIKFIQLCFINRIPHLQRMQADPYEFNASGAVCRAS